MEGEILNEDTAGSLELLYDQTYTTARQIGARVLGDDNAEDIAMETMIRAGQKLEDGMPLEEVAELVPMIAYGLAVDEYRRGEIPAGLGTEEDWLGALLDARVLSEYDAELFTVDFDPAVRALEADKRDAFILTDLRGLKHHEAADVLGAPRRTVTYRAQTARIQIREEIAA